MTLCAGEGTLVRVFVQRLHRTKDTKVVYMLHEHTKPHLAFALLPFSSCVACPAVGWCPWSTTHIVKASTSLLCFNIVVVFRHVILPDSSYTRPLCRPALLPPCVKLMMLHPHQTLFVEFCETVYCIPLPGIPCVKNAACGKIRGQEQVCCTDIAILQQRCSLKIVSSTPHPLALMHANSPVCLETSRCTPDVDRA